MKAIERIKESYLIPVVVIDDASRAADTAKALKAGGIGVMEITLRTEAALDSIEKASLACPDLVIGGGTVLSLDQCREAVLRGASFIVSPGFDPEIVDYCLNNNVAVFPGCITPTEITAALKKGLSIVKFFPAAQYGGAAAIKALSGPFSKIQFIPTGGIDLNNIKEYIIPHVCAIGGGWLCDRKAINAGDYEGISRKCALSLDAVKKIKG